MEPIFAPPKSPLKMLTMLLEFKRFFILGASSVVHRSLFDLKGWRHCNTPLILNKSKLDDSVKLPIELINKPVNSADDIQSIQAFKRSQSLLLGISFMPKYYPR